jgi:cysteinyl-tRNA synthetase
MSLQIYNTLSRSKEEFTPLHPDEVGIYVCGPTVYGHSHIGHAKSYVSFDVIIRYLRHKYKKVLYVQNITDVGHLLGDTNEGEDRLLKQGKLEHKHPMEIAEFYTRSYFEDMDALGVQRPDISPRATGHITEQIQLAERLIKAGVAYEANGSVYFDVSKDKEYGKLSGRNTEEAEAGTRVEVKGEKRHPNDFALWKKAGPEHIMQWPSPWGVGFPGWHLECSAMSMKYLGETFDIHGGGMDNQFPHHECEIAQSECATHKPFVKYWIHNNIVTVGGQKMGKSLGNTISLKDAYKKWDPLVVRFFILQSHYRGTLDFTNEAVEASAKGLEKLLNTVHNLRKALGANDSAQSVISESAKVFVAPFKEAMYAAMDDDFNTPLAIGVLFDLSRAVNTILAEDKPDLAVLKEADNLYSAFGGGILGIIPDSVSSTAGGGDDLTDGLMNLIIQLRAKAREQKQYAFSDQIRDGLGGLNIILEDKKDGTTWKTKG